MPNDKTVLILSSASNPTLEALASKVDTVQIYHIDANNVEDADSELENINPNHWLASESTSEVNGDTTDIIKLPKSVFNQ